MGRPPKQTEDLSPNYRKKLEAMSKTEADIHRAKTADSVYYTGIRKKVKMSDEYLCASAEMRERLMNEALKEAERRRQAEQRTWQQKAEAKGFTRNANGEWEQDLKVFRRYNNNLILSTPTPCDDDIGEKNISKRRSQGFTPIMVMLSELGGNLSMIELRCVEQKVQELIRAEEERNESYDSGTPEKTTMPIPETFDMPTLERAKTRADRDSSEENRARKRKRPSDFDSTEKEREDSRNLAITTGRPRQFGISHTPAATSEVCEMLLDGEKGPTENENNVVGSPEEICQEHEVAQPLELLVERTKGATEQSGLFQESGNQIIEQAESLPETEKESLPETENTRIEQPASTSVETNAAPVDVNKRVKLERNAPPRPVKKKTGFFDNVKWA